MPVDHEPPTEHRLHRRIFLSSSNLDLHAHRAVVVRVLREMGQEVIDMKDFGAQDGDATKISLDELGEADVVVFVVAWRYGSVPEGETHSVTHLEYLAAKKADLPRLVFLADPATEADDALFPPDLRNADHQKLLEDFRAELAEDRVAAFFSEPNDLANHVAAAVNRYLLGEQYREFLRSVGLRPPRDLPPPVPGFVGREQELADLCEQLRTGHSTGLSAAVSGMAGVGKSALAAEAVHRLATEPGLFPGGITFVRCDGQRGLTGQSWIYDRLLAAWNVDLPTEQLAQATTLEAEVDLQERVLRTRLRPPDLDTGQVHSAEAAYRGKEVLVLLDNVERELPLDRLLEMLAAVGLTALVTAVKDGGDLTHRSRPELTHSRHGHLGQFLSAIGRDVSSPMEN